MQKNGANFSGDLCVTASERLRCLHADKIEAQSLVKTVQLLGVEAWYGMGFYLAQASDAGLPMKELADTELLLRLGILGVGSGQAASSFPISDDFDSIFDETGPKVRLGSSKSPFGLRNVRLYNQKTKDVPEGEEQIAPLQNPVEF